MINIVFNVLNGKSVVSAISDGRIIEDKKLEHGFATVKENPKDISISISEVIDYTNQPTEHNIWEYSGDYEAESLMTFKPQVSNLKNYPLYFNFALLKRACRLGSIPREAAMR